MIKIFKIFKTENWPLKTNDTEPIGSKLTAIQVYAEIRQGSGMGSEL